jgi:hypothetical protein
MELCVVRVRETASVAAPLTVQLASTSSVLPKSVILCSRIAPDFFHSERCHFSGEQRHDAIHMLGAIQAGSRRSPASQQVTAS